MYRFTIMILLVLALAGCTTNERYDGKALTENGLIIDRVTDEEFVPECIQVARKVWDDSMSPNTVWVKTYCLEEE